MESSLYSPKAQLFFLIGGCHLSLETIFVELSLSLSLSLPRAGWLSKQFIVPFLPRANTSTFPTTVPFL